MKINFVCVGSLKEKFLRDAVAEYSKRLSRFCKLNIIEVDEQNGDINSVLKKEGADILSKLRGYVIALEIGGQNISSEDFAKKLDSLALNGHSEISFVIGGSHGLNEAVSKKADYSLSFGAMTFPHQLMRVILIEQLYRAFMINTNTPYHK